MRAAVVAVAMAVLWAPSVRAEWQARPFLGVTFGGGTTLLDLAGAAGSPNVVIGGTAALMGDVFGIEGDFGYAPGFFQSGDQPLVRGNSVTTLTGNAIIAVPRHLTRYTLGPYFVVGGGMMHTHVDDVFDLVPDRTLAALDIGGGATGFLTNRIGLNWDARYFTSVGEGKVRGSSISPQQAAEQLSFWRASMGLVFRY
jgi:hypothetical protein